MTFCSQGCTAGKRLCKPKSFAPIAFAHITFALLPSLGPGDLGLTQTHPISLVKSTPAMSSHLGVTDMYTGSQFIFEMGIMITLQGFGDESRAL